MADEKRNLTIVLNGKEIQNSIQAITKSFHQQRAAVAKMTRGTEQYKAAVKELKKTKRILDDHNKSIRGGARAWSRIKETALGFVGGSLITAGLGVLKQGITSLIKGITELDESLGKLQSITGVSDEQLAKLKDQAFVTGNQLGKTAKDIIDAYTVVGSEMPALLQNSAALDSMTRKAIILSKATKTELGPTIADLTSIMNANGATANESTRFINALAAGSQKGAKPVSFLAQAMQNVGPSAKSANVSIEQQVAILEKLGEKGVVASKAGTGLRNVLITLQQDQANFTDGQFDLNKALNNLAPIMDDAVALTDQFGKENVVVAQILAQNKGEIDALTEAVTGTNTAYEQAEINMDTLAGKTEELSAKWDNLKISVADGDGVFSKWGKNAITWIDEVVGGLQLMQDGVIDYQDVFTGRFDRMGEDLAEHALGVGKGILNTSKLKEVGLEALEAEALILEELISTADADGFVKITNSAGETTHKVATLRANLLTVNEAIGELKPIDIGGGEDGQDNPEQQLRTLKIVREELSALKKARQEIVSTDFTGLATNAKKIEALEEELALAEASGIVREQIAKLEAQGVDTLEQAIDLEEQKTAILQTGAEMRAEIEAKIDDEATQERIKNRKDQEEAFLANLENMIQDSINLIFAIRQSNINRETDEKIDALDEQLEADLITEQQRDDAVEEIKKTAFEKKKKADVTQALMNGALSITKIFAQMGVWGFLAAIPVAAATAFQVSEIRKQKYSRGGLMTGPSHAEDGMPVVNPRTGQVEAEVEGGEFIVRKSSVTPTTLPMLNAINEGNLRGINYQKFNDGGFFGQQGAALQLDPLVNEIRSQTQEIRNWQENFKVSLPLKDLDSQQNRRDKVRKLADVG